MRKEFIDLRRELYLNGYRLKRTKGSHFIFFNEKKNDSVTVNKDINRMVAQRLRKEHHLI